MLTLLVAASVGFALARSLRVPAVPMLVLMGAVAGAVGALPDSDFVQDALVFGVTFLVFAAGTELDLSRIGAQRRTALRVGLAQFAVLAVIGGSTAALLGFDPIGAMYVALALTASSTLVVVRLLRRRQHIFEPFGRVLLGVLLLQDFLVVLIAPVLDRASAGPLAMASGLALTLLLACAAWAVSRWVAPPIFVDANLDEESLVLTALALLFLFVGLSWVLDLPLVSGAFLAGVALSRFPVNGLLRAQLSSFGDFFLAVFLVALGASIAVPTADELLLAGALIAVVVLVTPPLVTLIGERAGLTTRTAIEAGLLLAQTSELSLVVVLLGWQGGHVSASTLKVVAIVTVVTMVLTPLLATPRVAWCLMAWHPFRARAAASTPAEGHVVLLGCGPGTEPLLVRLIESGRVVVVVDEDPAVLVRAEAIGALPLRGDGCEGAVLEAAGVPRARAVLSTLRRVTDHEALLALRTAGPVLVRVFDPADAAWVRARGGEPIVTAEAATAEVLRWIDAGGAPAG